MAEEAKNESSVQDMEVVPVYDQTGGDAAGNGVKRKRDDGDELEDEKENSVEEERLQNGSGPKGPVLGFKSFTTSVAIYDYFSAFLRSWSPNVNVNKYEHMMLLDLLQKGHQEPEKKIGDGVKAFQVRYHPEYKSRCFFLVRNDDSCDDFSLRKCVDHILPLPENMQKKSGVNKALGGRNGGGGRGGWRGRGGGKPRN
ncbi:hypothetical protein DCAR_0624732 [Daucus carota subsp. sativus]|uniref:Uncharacterized protein n=1 Tax=Daucus carota subsp. sativus TaxID=79200 RepID=A0AAF1B6T0_DAUCS|nr:PREDICTED: uncharacterized protein LOC108226520 [Daucus carota subsp. sativus]WOH05316.1 hypothetical protein DCAR_0624732 [Daucus carota subsp. sativus]